MKLEIKAIVLKIFFNRINLETKQVNLIFV